MGWIGVAGGSSVVTKPIFTRKNNKDVLAFLRETSPNFFTIGVIDEEAGVENIKETHIILNDLIRRKLIEEEKGKYGIPSRYTPEQYNAVLEFFQENKGRFYSVSEITEESGIFLTLAETQAILIDQLADPGTGVIRDLKSGKYGIPKKRKK